MNETPIAVLDQAAFERVWRRVMPQDRPDCPFTLSEPELTPTAPPQPLVRAAMAPAPVSGPVPQPVPCLGEASLGELSGLEARMEKTAQAQREYRALERRSGRRGLFSTLAAEKNRQLRRLNAAYFLISGQNYAPTPVGESSLPKNNALALRERFRAEQLEAAALMEAAQSAADPCVAQLYRELAEENHSHAHLLRRRLERL